MPTRLFFPQAHGSVWTRVFHAFVLTSVEAFFAALCLLAGIPVLFSPSFAPVAIKLMGSIVAYSWAAGMVAGGGTTLFGIGKANFRIERMGVAILAAVASVFTIALVSTGAVSALGVFTYFMFGAAMIARYWVLGKMIKLHNQWQDKFFQRLKREAGHDVD
jgi:hypothetical protein